MVQKSIIFGTGGFILGCILASVLTLNLVNSNKENNIQVKNPEHVMSDGYVMDNNHGTTMEDMVGNLNGKNGDEFDKEFIRGMIEHHQGAIEMAKLAEKQAGHDEIKKMANDIISAQTTEINQMIQWQKTWGY